MGALAYAEEEQYSRAWIFAAIAGVFLLSVGCEIYGEFFRDESASLYLYESWPGLLILALNLGLLAAAWLSTWDTYWKESSGGGSCLLPPRLCGQRCLLCL